MLIVLRRLAAFLVDLMVLGLYAGLLFLLIAPHVRGWFAATAARAELAGFLLLTLPFVLYFVVCEASGWSASLGKRLLKLRVVSGENDAKRVTVYQSICRSVLKFIPWELAHFAIWNAFVFESDLSGVALGALVLSYVLLLVYAVGLFRTSHRPLYDRLAGTAVVAQSSVRRPD